MIKKMEEKIFPMSTTEVIRESLGIKLHNPYGVKSNVIAFRADLKTQFMIEVLRYKKMIENGYMSFNEAIRTAENRTGYKI